MKAYAGETVLTCLDIHAVEKAGDVFLVDRVNGEDVCYNFKDAHSTVEAVAKSLAKLFPGSGHKISILSKNRAHWVMCDLGVLRSGNVLAPLFASMPPETFRYAIDFANIELLFVGEAGNWDEVKDCISGHVKIVSLPGIVLPEADWTFEEFLDLGAATPLSAHPDPEVPCTIIYTSGTTGKPKGVMHSLKTLYAAVSGIAGFTGPQTRFFSYLPLAHLGDRAVNTLHAAQVGGRLAFNESLETFGADMKAAAPTFLMGVPRIWEKLLQGVLSKFGGDADALREKLTAPGGEEVARQIRAGFGLQNANFMLAGTAATSRASKEWYALFGMPLNDIYAQTELLPITCAMGGGSKNIGVGPTGPGYTVTIAEDGEIVTSGPSQALGYYNNAKKTAETFVDGWVHTGDKGYLDEEGNLHITGRVQDTFKTSKGKYVAPVPIESKFAHSVLVEQQCLYGFGLTQPVMLCALSETARQELGQDNNKIVLDLTLDIQELNQELEPHERIGGIIICEKPWTTESGILTHTMKLKRDKLAEAYLNNIGEMAQKMLDGTNTLLVDWV